MKTLNLSIIVILSTCIFCSINSVNGEQASDNDTSSTTHPVVFNVNINATEYSPQGRYFVGMVHNGTNPLVAQEIGTFTLNIMKVR